MVAVDVGSVRRRELGNYAWSAFDLERGQPPHLVGAGRTPDGTARSALEALRAGMPVALGLEAPGMVPVPDPDNWPELGRARLGEENRSWSAGAGAGALCTGLVQAAWLMQAISIEAPSLFCTCDPTRWRDDAALLLWEAFVSAGGKPVPTKEEVTAQVPSQHEADAAAAAAAFDQWWQAGDLTLDHSDVTTGPHRPLNLFAAAALAAPLDINQDELTSPLLVIKTPPS